MQGVDLPGHPAARYIRRFAADGGYSVEYCSAESKALHIERGRWSLSGIALTIDTDFVDGAKAKFEDHYETKSFDGNAWTLTLTASDTLTDEIDDDYDALRVNDALQMTGC